MELTPPSSTTDLMRLTVRPPSYVVKSSFWQPGDPRLQWNWVVLYDLMASMNAIMFGSGSKVRFKEDDYASMLEGFALLNKRENGVGLFTWVCSETHGLNTAFPAERFRFKGAYSEPAQLLIPERWSDLIIEMLRQGVVKVTVGSDPSSDELKAHMFDGSTAALHWEGGDKYTLHKTN